MFILVRKTPFNTAKLTDVNYFEAFFMISLRILPPSVLLYSPNSNPIVVYSCCCRIYSIRAVVSRVSGKK